MNIFFFSFDYDYEHLYAEDEHDFCFHIAKKSNRSRNLWNPKLQASNSKRFDRLTILSKVEGQISNSKYKWPKLFWFFQYWRKYLFQLICLLDQIGMFFLQDHILVCYLAFWSLVFVCYLRFVIWNLHCLNYSVNRQK